MFDTMGIINTIITSMTTTNTIITTVVWIHSRRRTSETFTVSLDGNYEALRAQHKAAFLSPKAVLS